MSNRNNNSNNNNRSTKSNHKHQQRVNGRFVSKKANDEPRTKDGSRATTKKEKSSSKAESMAVKEEEEHDASMKEETTASSHDDDVTTPAQGEGNDTVPPSSCTEIDTSLTSPSLGIQPNHQLNQHNHRIKQKHEQQQQQQQHLMPFLAPPITLKQVIHQVYTYWVQKRSKLKKPLLRRYWPVTSTNDLNPHMVFRPRDQVKRKLRKKRQNDLEAYKKMKQLKHDFERVRVLCDLILKRETVFSTMVELTNEYFEERLYEWTDTSGLPRESRVLNKRQVENAILDVPKYFDDGPIVSRVKGGKKRKRSSATGISAAAAAAISAGVSHQMDIDCHGTSPVPPAGSNPATAATALNPPAAEAIPPPRDVIVAGHDGGYPAPSFLHPLATRESHYVTSWENAVPFIPSYEDGKPTPTNRFHHRPRLGRGGRIVIDRLPCPSSAHEDPDDPPPPTVITYGSGMQRSGYHINVLGADGPNYTPNTSGGTDGDKARNYSRGKGTSADTAPRAPPAQQLEDLMPKSLGDPKLLSRRIEEICAMGLVEDCQTSAEASLSAKGSIAPIDSDDVDEVLIPIEDWMEAPDGQIYGKERFVIGPL